MEGVDVAEEGKDVTTASQHNDSQLADLPEPQELEELEDKGLRSSSLEFGLSISSSGFPPTLPCPPCSQGSAVSALQSKVKALAECKTVWKPPSKKSHEKKVIPGSYMLGSPLTWGSSSSDEDTEPQTQTLTFCGVEGDPQVLLPNEGDFNPAMLDFPRGLGEGASFENIAQDNNDEEDDDDDNDDDDACKARQDMSSSSSSTCYSNRWAPPKGFWRVTRPETLLLNGQTDPGRSNGLVKTDIGVQEQVERYNTNTNLESPLHTCGHSRRAPAEPQGSGLWRAESLESVCSSGSSLSLAERVEMNRSILRQMLQKAQIKHNEGQQVSITEQRMEDAHSRGALNDSDWDSGISLHGGEHTQHTQRAIVWGDVLPLSPRHEQAKRLLERARMKARSNPLKADHTILPVQRDNPDLLSWASLQRAPLAGKEGVAAGSGNISDSSSSDSAGGPRRRLGQSPTRVRFEDESEKEAEFRYLERLRQRRRAGERAQGLLGSKPSLASYVNGRGLDTAQSREDSPLWKYKNTKKGQESNANGHYKPLVLEVGGHQCNSCGTILDGQKAGQKILDGAVPDCSLPLSIAPANGVSEGKVVPCWVAPTLPNRLVRIEPIKETYIGAVGSAIVDSDGTHCRETVTVDSANSRGTLQQKQKRKSRRRDEGSPETTANGLGSPESPPTLRPTVNGAEMHLSTGTLAIPPNPYAPEQLCQKVLVNLCKSQPNFKAPVPPPVPPRGEPPSPRLPQPVPPPLQPRKSALKSATKDRPNGQRVVKLMPSPHYRLVHLDSEEGGVNVEDSPEVSPALGNPSKNSTAMHPGQTGYHPAGLDQDQITGEVTTSPADHFHGHLNGGQNQGPVRPEHHREDSPSPSHSAASVVDQKETRPKLSLRRFFSAIGLNSGGRMGKERSSSMEQLSLPPKPSASPSMSPSTVRAESGRLRKAPSLQSLRLGSPLVKLKKSSSVQNLQSPRRKGDRSTAYTPGEQPCSSALSRGLQRTLSVEDVGSPSAVRSVGRVAQAFPDGTLLLELSRPPDGPFGFLISRGKGRPDSGVYVEEMGDSSTQKLYAGLLGVGDEILEVNGEKVAGLSLELVTRLMTQNSIASIRVLRHRRPHR
ncbi:uncharacterized protein KIAA1614 isoform X1 [Astyanax mexicanus]|uniref:uncharacterized protein KIAA1614 isoform X1 n=1 Tax=Astyanax mexicanus TaxID=7994 RepID=UPI0020CAB8EF|nr:uncharacterized protein KIAA1614 isoform X1 [Astyanax mexicanus]